MRIAYQLPAAHQASQRREGASGRPARLARPVACAFAAV